jgi:teichuronic acid biosynthesis glycosyltransferase TuaC
MRLLFIANVFPNPLKPTKGVFNLQLMRAIARAGHDVRVVSPVPWFDEWQAWRTGSPGNLGDRHAQRDGISVYYPRYYYTPKILRSWYGWFYERSIRRTLREVLTGWRPDAVLGYWLHPDGQASATAARMARAPAGVIVGGSDLLLITNEPSRRKRVQAVLDSLDFVVTVNEHLKQKAIELGVDAKKVHVWQQGVDETVFFPGDRDEARTRLSIRRGPPVLLWVGHMVPVKGLEILLEACALLRGRNVPFRLFLVGDGPLREQLASQVNQRNLGDAVTFVGKRLPEQLGNWFRAADLFVLSSWSEGLPNVLRETLACGTPFVASDVGGIAEIAGDSNRLFPAGDANAMANAIIVSLAKPAGCAPASGIMSWAQSAQALLEIIESTSAAGLQSRPASKGADQFIPREAPMATAKAPAQPLA